jgi:septal ring factor EnvC (AmiA/AmiB activator)
VATEGGGVDTADPVVNTLYATLAFLAFVLLLVVLATKDAHVTVSQKLTELTTAVNNVTATVHLQNQQIADLRAQVQASQADKAQADADVATLQAQVDALNALTVPAPPAN